MAAIDDLVLLAPWSALSISSEKIRALLEPVEIPTLRDLATGKVEWLASIVTQLGTDADANANVTDSQCLEELRRDSAEANRVASRRSA